VTETPTATAVTIVGTGVMGSALGRALLAAQHPVTVWNRTPTRALPLVEEGAMLSTRLTDAISASDATLMCVSDQAAVRVLLDDPDVRQALRTRTLVQLTTGTAAEGRSGQALAADHGIAYLDGAIMASPRTIGSDVAVILYAGSRDVFTANETLLSRLGTARYVGEDAGRTAIIDAALIGFFYGTLAGFLHGAILARSERIGLEEYLGLARPFFAGFVTDAVQETGDRMLSRNYADPQSSMNTHLAGIDLLVLGVSREARIEDGVMSAIKDTFERAVAAGRGDDDIASLVEVAMEALQRPA